jgi:hypothetical protein
MATKGCSQLCVSFLLTNSNTCALVPPPLRLCLQIPLPYLPAAPPLGPLFLLGTVVLLAGLLVFNAPLWLPVATRGLKAWAADNGSGNSSGGGSSSGQLAVK